MGSCGGGGGHPETFIPRREETGESAGIMEVSQGLCEGFTSTYCCALNEIMFAKRKNTF